MPLASSRCIRTALASCGFKLKNNDELSYESTIKGVISRDKLEKLNGVTTKVMLLWLNIMEILVIHTRKRQMCTTKTRPNIDNHANTVISAVWKSGYHMEVMSSYVQFSTIDPKFPGVRTIIDCKYAAAVDVIATHIIAMRSHAKILRFSGRPLTMRKTTLRAATKDVVLHIQNISYV
ncbi:hypothetical protein RJ639_006383 [Escallonia herrerae]|uniref:Uncharacterized protein n=1 Tax=Escallonia herrerae TaxID=1293975 RepID=A0AA89AU02_9ASTE|nr:hypothetical protein RJ639_006383 [Escallonia herrerae]